MKINRVMVFFAALILATFCELTAPFAQEATPFNPIAFAKLRAGEIAREIESTPRDKSYPEPSRSEVFDNGLLLQAGLRALLPPGERDGVASPGLASTTDPKDLIEAQENYKAVFASDKEASPEQKSFAVASIQSASQKLDRNGYTEFSRRVVEWLRQAGYFH